MIEIKNNFNGGLNLDDSPYLVPNNSYIDALNVTRDAIEGSNDRALTNIVGNQSVPYNIIYGANISTNIENTSIGGSDNAVTITFNGNQFIPPGYTVNIYKNGGVKIAEYITQSTLSISELLSNLYNSLVDYGYPITNSISVQGNTLYFELSSYGYVTAVNFTYLYEDLPIRCIGAYPDTFRNKVIYFLWAESGYHSVVEYDNSTRTSSPIFTNLFDSDGLDILGFTEHNKINSINVYHRNIEEGEGDLLYFLDSLGRPTVMDILRFKNGEYTPVTRDIIDVGKRPPLLPPQCLYNNDTTRNINSLRDRFFRFKYRYVYDNNEKSTCSPISVMPLPEKLLDKNEINLVTNNNVITVAMNSGEKDVKFVELLMSYVNKTNDWSDFALVDSINKADFLGLKYSYIITTQAGDPTPIGYSQALITFDNYQTIGQGTVVQVYFNNLENGEKVLAAEYTVLQFDDIIDVINGLVSSCNSSGLLSISALANLPNKINFIFSNADATSPDIKWAFDSVVIDNKNDSLDFSYSFYNDASYPLVDINESIQLFDYVPDKANAQEMPNGNVLLYGGITEGYDRNLTPNVVNEVLTIKSGSTSGGQGQFNATWAWNARFERTWSPDRQTENYITFSGVPLAGTVIEYYYWNGLNSPSESLVCFITTLPGETYVEVASRLLSAIYNAQSAYITYTENSIPGAIYFRYMASAFPYYSQYVSKVVISQPILTTNVLPTFLYSTQRKLGIAYFDKKGKTNGILYSGDIKFPDYDEDDNEMLLPYINTKIYHKPPEWAYSYGFYLNKENTQFLYWEATSVKKITVSGQGFYYFDISNLQTTQDQSPTKASVLSWSFQTGDRLRLIKRTGSSPYNVYGDIEVAIEGIVKDPNVGGLLPGTYVKTLSTTALDSAISSIDTIYLIQLYRNNQQKPGGNNEVYYEFGQQYLIGNPTLPSRYHIGMVQDQGESPTFSSTKSRSVNDITISFSGTVFPGTATIINGTGSTIYASYISQQGDGIEDIVDELITQLSTYVSSDFVNVIKLSSTQIIIRVIPPADITLVEVILPSLVSIPAEFNFYYGDVFFRGRQIYKNQNNIISFTCVDRNVIDDYNSAVNSVNGRSNIVDINAKKAYYSTMVRFSNAYQPNTNVNGTNRFYPNNFDEYDYSYGDIMRFKVRDRFIRVFQKNKVGQVPLYHQILKEQNKESLVVTDKLLNPIQYYIGEVGIGDNPESLASYSFADYFVSNQRGVICRVSNNGVDFLSVMYKVNSWTTEFLPSRTGNYKVYGVFDNRLGDYIIALEATDTDSAHTLMFDEEMNSFSTFLSYHPEMMTCLNTLLITFKDGELYTHDSSVYNNFYDVQYGSSITTLFNDNPLDKKTFLSVAQVASSIWECPTIQTDLVSEYSSQKMESNLISSDFAYLEGTYEAPILRDANSPGGVYSGDAMKGKYILMEFNNSQASSLIKLNSLSLKYINSPLNNR